MSKHLNYVLQFLFLAFFLLVLLREVRFVPCRGGEDPAFHPPQEPSDLISDLEHQQPVDHDLKEDLLIKNLYLGPSYKSKT